MPTDVSPAVDFSAKVVLLNHADEVGVSANDMPWTPLPSARSLPEKPAGMLPTCRRLLGNPVEPTPTLNPLCTTRNAASVVGSFQMARAPAVPLPPNEPPPPPPPPP